MKSLFWLMILIGLALLAWKIATVISPDAIAMAVGMLFGVLAGIPATLLVTAAGRRRDDEERQPTTQYSYMDYSTHQHLHSLPERRLSSAASAPFEPYVYRPVDDNDPFEW